VGGSNDAGGGAHDFSKKKKKYAFLSILWSKFLLKMRFLMAAKSVLMRPQGLGPGALDHT